MTGLRQPQRRQSPPSTPWWAVLSATAAPILLIGGWTLAARRQPDDYDSTEQTISSLAGLAADDRWLMTTALLGVGVCHLTTALGLAGCAVAGRMTLGLGGAATVAVAGFPLPAAGAAPAHGVAAGVAFGSLALWPALGWRRDDSVAPALRPAVAFAATAVLGGLLTWFVVALAGGSQVGLAERAAAGAQALWPLAAVLSTRLAAGRR